MSIDLVALRLTYPLAMAEIDRHVTNWQSYGSTCVPFGWYLRDGYLYLLANTDYRWPAGVMAEDSVPAGHVTFQAPIDCDVTVH